MRFIVNLDTKDLEKTLENAPMRVKRALADGMDHATRSFLKTFFNERLKGPPGIKHNPRGIMHRFRRTVQVNGKTIFLRQSKAAQTYTTLSGAKIPGTVDAIARSNKNPMNMTVEIYSQSKVAGIHERGGTINPGKNMLIPLNGAARLMMGKQQDLSHLVPIKINGKLFLAFKRGKEEPELMFLLKRSIRIKARLGFYSTWEGHSGRRQEIMDGAMQNALDKL